VVEWSIDVIIDNYINATAGVLQRCHEKKKYLEVTKVARAQWLKRQVLLLKKENYLGNNSFYAVMQRILS
jgi:DNA relaxase NicK